MPSTSEPMVQHLCQEFEPLLASVTAPDADAQTACCVEMTLFRQLLALGVARCS